MRHTTDTLADRGVTTYHFLRSMEKWYGLLINIKDVSRRQAIKEGIDKILEEDDKPLTSERDTLIYCKGTYSPAIATRLKKVIRTIDNAIFIEGDYEDFLGIYWVEENKHKVNYLH